MSLISCTSNIKYLHNINFFLKVLTKIDISVKPPDSPSIFTLMIYIFTYMIYKILT